MQFNFFFFLKRCAWIFNGFACLRRLWAPGGESMAFKSSSFLMSDDHWMYRKWAPRMESSPVPLLLPSTRVTYSLVYSLKEDFLCIYCFSRVRRGQNKKLCLWPQFTLTPVSVLSFPYLYKESR